MSRNNPIQNRNFLSPAGFNFLISKIRGVDFFCQTANVPEISMNPAVQATNLRNIPVPGDELYYGDLRLSFLVDEDMANYLSVHTWMRKLGFPVDREEVDFEPTDALYQSGGIKIGPDMVSQDKLIYGDQTTYNFETSDAALQILNSNYNIVKTIKFYDCFPISLSTLEFRSDVTDTQYMTAQVNFKYLYFDIV